MQLQWLRPVLRLAYSSYLQYCIQLQAGRLRRHPQVLLTIQTKEKTNLKIALTKRPTATKVLAMLEGPMGMTLL